MRAVVREAVETGGAHLNCICRIGEDFPLRCNPHLNCKCKIGEDLSLTVGPMG